MKNTFTLSEVPVVQVKRISTGYEFLDLCYGKTFYKNGFIAGLPVGAVSLWSGSPGVGKTRVGIAVAASINRSGHRVMFIQNEVSPEQFRTWTAGKVAFPDEFLIHTSRELDEQIEAIRKNRPHVVVLDSLNMIPGYQTTSVIRSISEKYREIAQKVGCHVILIGHLNKAGVVKGNNDIQYMIDIECDLEKYEDVLERELTRKERAIHDARSVIDVASTFVLTFKKNRYGPTSAGGTVNYVCFRHVGDGIEVVTSNFENPLRVSREDLPEPVKEKPRKRWSFFTW